MAGAGPIIVVTGATGRQGGAVARHLVADGWRVRGCDSFAGLQGGAGACRSRRGVGSSRHGTAQPDADGVRWRARCVQRPEPHDQRRARRARPGAHRRGRGFRRRRFPSRLRLGRAGHAEQRRRGLGRQAGWAAWIDPSPGWPRRTWVRSWPAPSPNPGRTSARTVPSLPTCAPCPNAEPSGVASPVETRGGSRCRCGCSTSSSDRTWPACGAGSQPTTSTSTRARRVSTIRTRSRSSSSSTANPAARWATDRRCLSRRTSRTPTGRVSRTAPPPGRVQQRAGFSSS